MISWGESTFLHGNTANPVDVTRARAPGAGQRSIPSSRDGVRVFRFDGT